FLGVVVTGFTSLTEKFIQRYGTDRGADGLAQTLNCYLCDILEEILTFGGDILKFAGDAVLVLWRTQSLQPQVLAKTISLVLQCSLQIQEKYGSCDTEVGQKIHLKIGISAGHMNLLLVRGARQQYFCIWGKALVDVREAGELANAGEIILSGTSWEQCEQHRLRIRHLEGKREVKVGGWSHPPSNHLHFLSAGVMRPSLRLPNMEALRKYIPEAALRKLDDHMPLDVFSELRPVTSLFIHLQFPRDISVDYLRSILNEASRMMIEILIPHKGELSKIILFDKGCTFLCVFGLTGEKLSYESLHALQSALQIFNSCSATLKGVKAVSAAVSSGMVFCGVTGHPLRHEYTVIGQKVNMAARMMMHYPGLVSCDAATYAASQLPPNYFKELPETKMKGLSHPGTIYQYVGIPKESTLLFSAPWQLVFSFVFAGQQKEIDLFVSCLKAYEDLGKSHILAFEGTRGSGKSHLLTELARLGQAAGHRVVAVELLEVNMRQSFSAIHMLMARALGLQECEACSAREHVLQTKLEGTIEKSSYCLFNDIFCVKFPISDEVRKLHETHRKMKMHSTWAKVLEKTIGGEFGIFVIDNAHFIDPASWSIMSPVLCNTSLFMVVSLAPGYARTKFFCKAAADNTVSQNITYLHLGQLKPSDVVKKVCEDLGVVSISRDLARFLIQRSAGIPYYCEELLHCLRCNNMLSFHTQRQHGKAEDNWQSLITSAIEASALAATSNSSAGHDGRVCTIRPDVNLENAVLPVTLKEIVLAQLDQIALLKQKVLKFAAVIGPVFTTQMLLHILPASIRLRMNPLLDMLVGDNILMWLKKTEVPEDVQDPTKGAATSLRAKSRVKRPSPCKKTTEGQSGVLAFCAPLVQETAYELWPERQRVALHRKCAAFLEQHAHKCKSCGQGDFVAFHRFAVTSTQDRESCWGPADQGNSHSWEALVFAGEWLKRDRTNTTEGMLVARGFLATSKQTTELPSKTDGKSNSTCSCECKAIVESVLVPLARHCMAMGDAGRALYYLLECAAAYLHVSNSYMALMKLNEAEALRNSVEEQANVIARFEQATFFSLKGEVCCHMGYMKLAKKMIRKALSLLRRQFPKTSVGVVVKFCVETLPWARRASSLPQEVRRKKLAWLLRQSWCLSLLEHLFSLEGTSSRRTRSLLAVRMKANTDRAVNHYWAEDS
ncbi:ADCYA cyclase, partial [Rhynochetos jubatus]|nr:ADCYA cyclase [Rhynochetos jubatus]